MRRKAKFITAGACAAASAGLIALLRLADVAPIGPEGTSVGLSSLNRFVFELFGVNMIWYDITDWLGLAAIAAALVFALTGLIQLIRRKSLLKVDKEILLLGGLYIAVIGLYLLFETAIVNYRPVIMPGCEHPEASFPSSHTVLVCVVMGSAFVLIGRYIRNGAAAAILRAVCALITAVTVFGRLISGVHWFTDIVGGLLISAALLSLYSGLTDEKNEKDENDPS